MGKLKKKLGKISLRVRPPLPLPLVEKILLAKNETILSSEVNIDAFLAKPNRKKFFNTPGSVLNYCNKKNFFIADKCQVDEHPLFGIFSRTILMTIPLLFAR